MPLRLGAAALAAAALLGTAGCGGGDRQDADEAQATYTVETSKPSFPRLQGLGETSPFRLTVRNIGTKAIPNVALTVDGFADPQAQPEAMDPERPIWIVNVGPVGGRTAYVNTWTLGRLEPDEARTFTFSVTATVAGTHTLHYRVGAGLDGNAVARTADDTVPEGDFTVRVTRRPRESSVDPKTGEVIYKGE